MNQFAKKYLAVLEDLDYSSAEKNFSNEIASNVSYSGICHSGLAICLARNKKALECKLEVSKALENKEAAFLTDIALGFLAESEGDFSLAEEKYRAAIKSGGNESYAWFMYGTFLLSQKRHTDSLEKLLQSQKLNNESWACKANLALLYFDIKEFKLSSRYAIAAFALKPTSSTLQIVSRSLLKIYLWLPRTLILLALLAIMVYPHSAGPLILLSSVGILFSVVNYLATRNKTSLFLGLFLVLSCILYYIAYVN